MKKSLEKEIGVTDLFKPTGEKVQVLRRGAFPNTAIVRLSNGTLSDVYISDLKGSYAASNK